ncbi:MAG TPA: hypothetical protein EYP28_05045 [Methanophagales archaeon]|nr:hypothetical protein [Methanophagales archaeon]
MKISRSEYIVTILEFLIKKGPSSKYAISKGAAIPYPTVLRKLPEMAEGHMVQKVGVGKRGAEIYVATPKGTLITYFAGRVRASELFMALPSIMRHVPLSLEELPVVKDPFGFIMGELPFKLSQVEDMRVEEAVSILGVILIWRHDEWYHEIGKENLKRLLSWAENYRILRYLVAGTISPLEKMNEQAKRLSELAEDFLAEMDECAGR